MQQPLWPLLLNAQAWLVYTRAHADVHTKEVALYGMLSKVNGIFLGMMELSWLFFCFIDCLGLS